MHYFKFIDFVKAISCILVILFHAAVNIKAPDSLGIYYYLGGVLAIGFFVMASGFSLSLNKDSMPALEFYKSRAAKLFPPFWIAYIAVAIFLFIQIGRPLLPANPLDILFSFIGMDQTFMRFSGGYLVGEWYFGMLLLLYLLFPVVKYCVKKWPFLTFGISGALFILGVHYNTFLHNLLPFWHAKAHFTVTYNLPYFILGMIIAKNINNIKFMRIAAGLSALFLIINMGWSTYLPLMILCCMSYFVLVAYFYDRLKTPKIWDRLISFLAVYSFMAYLLQHQIIWAWSRINPYPAGTLTHGNNLISYLLGMVVLTYVAAVALTPLSKKLAAKLKLN